MIDMIDNEDKFDMGNIMMYQDGVLWYEKKPVYIVRAIKKGASHWVFVYEVSKTDYEESIKKDSKNPIVVKKHSRVRMSRHKFGSSTIGNVLNRNAEEEKDKVVEKENSYLFQVPVVYGTSSITGIQQDGFYERVLEYKDGKGNDRELVPTGVFIGLKDIEWETDTYKFDLESISTEIQRADREEAYSRSSLPSDGFYYK